MAFSGHHARKRFGQHWLKDESVLLQIVEAAALQPDDRVLEVGPGRGALTAQLLASPAASVQAVELDRDLVAGLQQRFAAEPRFQLQSGDVLALPQLGDGERRPTKVVANIPYNITGPLLERLVGRLDRPAVQTYQRLVLLLQKEVAERIRARPGQSCFSALSVRMQLLATCHSICPVPPRCFQPPPQVQSEVIAIDPKQRINALLRRWPNSWNACCAWLLGQGARWCATPWLAPLQPPAGGVARRGRHHPQAPKKLHRSSG